MSAGASTTAGSIDIQESAAERAPVGATRLARKGGELLMSTDGSPFAPIGSGGGPGLLTAELRVSPTGDNASDGLTPATAKLTLCGAYDAMPAGGGTIWFETGSKWSNGTEGGGVVDNNGVYLTEKFPLPAGWRTYKPVRIRAVSAVVDNLFPSTGRATLTGGLQTSAFEPNVWIVGYCPGFTLDDVALPGYAYTALRIGWDYARDSDGELYPYDVASATRTSNVTTLTINTLRDYTVVSASRTAAIVTLNVSIPGQSVPYWGDNCIVELSGSDNALFNDGTYTCQFVGANILGQCVVQYFDDSEINTGTVAVNATVSSHGAGVGSNGASDRITFVSADADFPSRDHVKITAVTLNTITYEDTGANNTSANAGQVFYEDRSSCNSANYTINNVSAQTLQPDRGPTVDVGASSAGPWCYFKDCCFSGSAHLGSDPDVGLAMLFDGGSFRSAAAKVTNLKTLDGAIAWYCGVATQIVMDEIAMDYESGMTSPPTVKIQGQAAAASMSIQLTNVQPVADGTNPWNVELYDTYAASTYVRSCGTVLGKCVNVSSAIASEWLSSDLSQPAREQLGFWTGGVSGYHPAALGGAAPLCAPAYNFIGPVSGWDIGSDLTTTEGRPDRYQGTQAVRFVAGAGADRTVVMLPPSNLNPITGSPITLQVGDRWALYLFAKAPGGVGGQTGAPIFRFVGAANGAFALTATPPMLGKSGWQWYGASGVVSVISASNAAFEVQMDVPAGATVEVCFPVLLFSPVGALDDNEWATAVMTIRPWAQYLTPGGVGTLRDQVFYAHGGIATADSRTVGVASGNVTIGATNGLAVPWRGEDGAILGWIPLYAGTVVP